MLHFGSARVAFPLAFVLALAAVFFVAQDAEAGNVVHTTEVAIGINDYGNLITSDSGRGFSNTGLLYVPTGADSIEAGCDCEGWGISYDGTNSGYANKANWPRVQNLDLIGYWSNSTTEAVSLVRMDDLRVKQDIELVSGSMHTFRYTITITNTGSVAHSDVMYRRIMDWEVEPTAYNEYITVDGIGTIPSLVQFTDDGHGSNDPLDPIGTLSISGPPYFVDWGPRNNGATFDFDFGTLLPGETFEFEIYYGAHNSEANALSEMSGVGCEVWSLGQPNTSPTIGAPNTFYFCFVGLVQPVAEFDWAPEPPCHEETILFDDLSYAISSSLPIEWVTWDLGDGTYMGPLPWPAPVSHNYDAPGTYTVNQTVTDIRGNQGWLEKDITVCNHAPDLSGPEEVFVIAGRDMSFQMDWADRNGDPATLSPASPLLPGMSFQPDSFRVHWSTDASHLDAPGPEYLTTFRATDVWGDSTTRDVRIIVLPPGSYPAGPQDADGDGIADSDDNCPRTFNPRQLGDEVGEHCTEAEAGGGMGTTNGGTGFSSDGEALPGSAAESPTTSGTDDPLAALDSDGDGVRDAVDICPFTSDPLQRDIDADGRGDLCDGDLDGDGIPQMDVVGRAWDNCPYTPNTDQADADNDGVGDACANDRDGDGVPTVFGGQALDNCPDTPNADQADGDGDGIGDACEGRPVVTGPDATKDVAGDATDVRASASLGGVLVWAGSGVLLLVAAVTVFLLVRRR